MNEWMKLYWLLLLQSVWERAVALGCVESVKAKAIDILSLSSWWHSTGHGRSLVALEKKERLWGLVLSFKFIKLTQLLFLFNIVKITSSFSCFFSSYLVTCYSRSLSLSLLGFLISPSASDHHHLQILGSSTTHKHIADFFFLTKRVTEIFAKKGFVDHQASWRNPILQKSFGFWSVILVHIILDKRYRFLYYSGRCL